jgi:low temperature requirement protein LtrA
MPGETVARFRRWFWRPPRAHGETIPDRTVSFLELFYDLVFVAAISQAAHHLAEHVSTSGLVGFTIVFTLIWIAWINGTTYLELHGREDGRTRSVVFLLMGLIALLAVFTADAAGAGGQAFAVVYAAFLVVMAWLWSTVLRQDILDRPDFVPVTRRFVIGTSVSAAVILLSAFLPPEPRLIVWAAFATAWVLVLVLLAGRSLVRLHLDFPPTDSLVERFGLFTIIVLGEVVFGVVDGMSVAEQDVKTISTGILALLLGFGFWWMYFDLIGRRLPRDGRDLATWLVSHLPITLSIAAAGAAMVSLIEHAHDPTTPEGTAWLLSGAVAVGLVAQAVAERTLVDAERLAVVYRPLTGALLAGAAAAIVVGWTRPAPWLLALLLVAILSALWFFAVSRFLRADAWGEERLRATELREARQEAGWSQRNEEK